jgi:hypothetical protein
MGMPNPLTQFSFKMAFIILRQAKTNFLFPLFLWFSEQILFFQRLNETQFEKILEDKDEKKIRCKICGHRISSSEKKIEVNGRHQHVFTNPAGVIYKIGCFSDANGCVNYGISSLEHTWFSDYSWRYALCSNCHTHLGWFYQSENNSFYGLILDNLEETA